MAELKRLLPRCSQSYTFPLVCAFAGSLVLVKIHLLRILQHLITKAINISAEKQSKALKTLKK